MSSIIKKDSVLGSLSYSEGKTIPLQEKQENEQENKELELLENELRKEYENEIDNLKREVICDECLPF